MDRQDRIEREVVLSAPIERVWSAITEAAQLAQWFGDVAELDLRLGGTARFGWTEYGSTVEAIIETVEPPLRFAFRWTAGSATSVEEGPSTLVEFSLEKVAQGTRLRVVESGFAELPGELYSRQLEENTSGWTSELSDLADYLSSRQGASVQ